MISNTSTTVSSHHKTKFQGKIFHIYFCNKKPVLLPHLIASVFNLNSCIPLAKWMLFPNFICSVSDLGLGAMKLYSICCSHQNCAVKSLTLRYPTPHLNLSRGGRNSLDETRLSVPSSFSLSPVDLTSNEQNKNHIFGNFTKCLGKPVLRCSLQNRSITYKDIKEWKSLL